MSDKDNDILNIPEYLKKSNIDDVKYSNENQNSYEKNINEIPDKLKYSDINEVKYYNDCEYEEINKLEEENSNDDLLKYKLNEELDKEFLDYKNLFYIKVVDIENKRKYNNNLIDDIDYNIINISINFYKKTLLNKDYFNVLLNEKMNNCVKRLHITNWKVEWVMLVNCKFFC